MLRFIKRLLGQDFGSSRSGSANELTVQSPSRQRGRRATDAYFENMARSRSWHGWHRHVSMVMLAFAMMAAIRHHANPPQPKKTQRRTKAKTKPSPPRH
jgi:hypothetical protein